MFDDFLGDGCTAITANCMEMCIEYGHLGL